MSVKEKVYQIVADNSLSVEEKYAAIQNLLHGKNGGAGGTSGGTGRGSGNGIEQNSSSSSSSDSENNGDSENGKESQNSSKNAQSSAKSAANSAQAAAQAAQDAADAAQAAADEASKNGDPDSAQKQAAAQAAQDAADAAQAAADAAAESAESAQSEAESGNSEGAQSEANEAQRQASEAQKQANEAQKQAGLAGAGKGDDNSQQNQNSGKGGQGQQDNGDSDEGGYSENQKSTSGGNGSQNQQNQNGNQNGTQNQQNQNGGQSQQNQNQQNQNQQNNQNNGKGGQGQQDIEDALKNLDLGEKQRYKKAKGGDDSDDQYVNGLPPGEIEDDGGDDDFGGGGMPKQFDDYKAGKYIGIAYAKEVFKGRGVKPIYANIYDIPDVDPMVLVESMLTESEDDIRNILSGGGDASEKADAICKLLFPDSDVDNAPENLILMRNGDVSLDDWGNDDHLITKELGDEIKKEIKEMPNSIDQDIKEIDPDWGSTGSDGEIQERMKYIEKLLDPNYIQDKLKRERAKEYISKFGARIEKNSEGIIDWKSTLEEFIMYTSTHREQGSIRQNVYTFSGIGARRRKKVFDQIGKIVIYADTSGSAYNFCSTMISEVSKIARDCNVSEFDIHLFTDVVYATHYGISSDTVKSEDFGFTDVDSGGTDLNNVYNHIIDHYVDGYTFADDVACIIIMTDVDGVKDSASSKLKESEYLKENLDKMLYLIFDPSNTTRRALQKYLPKDSKWLAITPDMLSGELGESVSVKKGYSVLEAIKGNLGDVKDKLYNVEKDADKRRLYMKRANVAAMRDLDRLDQLVPEIFAAIEQSGLNLKSTKSVEYFEDTDNSFYIDDDLRVWIHMNVDKGNTLKNFFNLCSKINVYKLVGNINVVDNYKIDSLPSGFPEIIEGKLYICNLPNLKSLDNLPLKTDDCYINIWNSRKWKNDLKSQAKLLGINIEDDDPDVESFHKGLFEKRNVKGKMRINEAIGGKKLSDIKAKVNKEVTDNEEERKEYMRKTNIRAMRDLDRLDQLVPEIFAAMNEIFPEMSVAKEVEIFEDKENKFYIDDDLRLWIHKDFKDRMNVRSFLELCKKVDVFMVVGDVWIVNMLGLKELPKGFPQEIKGHFKLQNLPDLRNLNNAPHVIYGGISPTLEIKSYFIRPATLNDYRQSLRDKQNNAVDPITVLKNEQTYGNMNNTIKESEIARRIAIGQRFLNENFPSNLKVLKKPVRPQMPNYLDIPDEDNVPAGRLDAMRRKRERGMERYEEKERMYNDTLLPLYNKNLKIFREFITPLLDADWGAIPDKDVVCNDTYKEIHDDLVKNNTNFKGVKIFTDDRNNITLIYAKTENDDACKIIYFVNDNGEVVTDSGTIADEISERDNIYRTINDYFLKKSGFKWDDLPDRIDSDVERVLLCLLYWIISNAKELDKSGRKQFEIEKVIYNPNGDSYLKWSDDCLYDIYQGRLRDKNFIGNSNGDLVTVTYYLPEDAIIPGQVKKGGTKDSDTNTINFNPVGTNGPGYASQFAESATLFNKNNNTFNPAVYFSDDVLKSILMGLSIRAEYDHRRVDNISDILNADRETLLDMIHNVLDVNVFASSLKYMTYKNKSKKSKDIDIDETTGEVGNPQGVLLLFPDKCRIEYVINADIKQSVLDNYSKRAIRSVRKSGRDLYNKKRSIVDKGSGKYKMAETTLLDQFMNITSYFNDKNLKNTGIKDIVRQATDEYGKTNKFFDAKRLYKKFENAIKEIIAYPSIITDDLKKHPEKENNVELEDLVEHYTVLEDMFEEIVRNQDDVNHVIDTVNSILDETNRIISSYSTLVGYFSDKERRARLNALRKEEQRKRAKELERKVEREPYDTTRFEKTIDEIPNLYNDAADILQSLDFSQADMRTSNSLHDKGDMNRRVEQNIIDTAKFAESLISSGDYDKIKDVERSYKDLNQILGELKNLAEDGQSDRIILRTVLQLVNLTDAILDDAERYQSLKSRKSSMHYTA